MFCSSALFGGGGFLISATPRTIISSKSQQAAAGRGFEDTDLASLAHLERPTVCHGHPVQILLLTSSLKQAWTR